ncbi:restriction endonuclease subunit S [Rhodanobacter umsongensis]
MGCEWRDCELGEFVRLQRGHDLTALERTEGHYPVMGSAGQNGTHVAFKARGPGVVIGRSGASAGRVHFCPIDYWPHNTCLYVTDFLGNDPRFAYYYLSTLSLADYNSGSAQPSLNRNFIYTKSVSIPSPETQREIAALLGGIDDHIDLLRQTNTTLEAIAQALFKSWFVDFYPVRAKAEGREPEAMDVATAALFPSEFEESKLGLIPKGWGVGTFGDVALQSKGSVSPLNSLDTEFDHYSLPAFDAGLMPVHEFGEAIKSNKTPVPNNAVLISKLNPHIPRIWFTGEVRANAVCSTEFLVWTPVDGVTAEYVFCLATSTPFNTAMKQLVTGTSNSHQRVKPDYLRAIAAVVPPRGLTKAFGRIAEPLLQRVQENRSIAQSLTQLRDTLLPRLISGELRLPEAMEVTQESLV